MHCPHCNLIASQLVSSRGCTSYNKPHFGNAHSYPLLVSPSVVGHNLAVSIGNCHVIGIEGTHGTGKTSLAHALTASFGELNLSTSLVSETVRESPFFRAALVHHDGEIDEWAELHLVVDQVRRELVAAQDYEMLICDRTIVSALAYWNLRAIKGEREQKFYDTLSRFAAYYASEYDLIFYTHDYYDLQGSKDRFRDADETFRSSADGAISDLMLTLGVEPVSIPTRLSVAAKADWCVARAREHLGSSVPPARWP